MPLHVQCKCTYSCMCPPLLGSGTIVFYLFLHLVACQASFVQHTCNSGTVAYSRWLFQSSSLNQACLAWHNSRRSSKPEPHLAWHKSTRCSKPNLVLLGTTLQYYVLSRILCRLAQLYKMFCLSCSDPL